MKICLIGLAVSCPHLLLSVRWPRRAGVAITGIGEGEGADLGMVGPDAPQQQSARGKFIVSVLHAGKIRAAPLPCFGQTAPKM